MTFRRLAAIPRCYGGEEIVRSRAYKLGLRYRLAPVEMPGRPHLVFPKHNAILFVCGCREFLHGCQKNEGRSALFHDYELGGGRRRLKNLSAIAFSLARRGWRTQIVWGCEAETIDLMKAITGADHSSPMPLASTCIHSLVRYPVT